MGTETTGAVIAMETDSISSRESMDRTISLDDPKEQLAPLVKWAERERKAAAHEGNEQDEAYFANYGKELSQWIDSLKDGVAESRLQRTVQSADSEWERVEDPQEADMAYPAKRDAANQILAEVFGHGLTKMGRIVRGSNGEDGEIKLVGETGDVVTIAVKNKAEALSNADRFLREAGYSVADLQPSSASDGE